MVHSMSEIRVRFPPSPTGFLHIGGARTALFNWLFARHHKGKFLLRIEDTDRERSAPEYTQDIIDSLKWLGFDLDEKIVFQSERLDRHLEVVEELLAKGLAYRCDCSSETLEAFRQKCIQEKVPFRYPGNCREKKQVGTPNVVRMKTPQSGVTSYQDLCRGEITVPNKDIDDWVILRSDSSPTYNFVCVVDDHDQAITHVLRGDDHINNTPKQVLLYQSLAYALPQFAHFPMILGSDKTKLSKRHGAASTLEYRKMGYLPEALINFLVRLGWGHGDQEIFTVDELVKYFSLEKVGASNAIFNTEKLDWVSGHHMRQKDLAQLSRYLWENFSEKLSFAKAVDSGRFERGVEIIRGKVKNCLELIDQLDCLFGEDPHYDTSQLKLEDKEVYLKLLKSFRPILEASAFSVEALERSIRDHGTAIGEKFGKVAHAIRYAVTGGKVSPGLFEMLEVQGKAVVLRRFDRAVVALGSGNG